MHPLDVNIDLILESLIDTLEKILCPLEVTEPLVQLLKYLISSLVVVLRVDPSKPILWL